MSLIHDIMLDGDRFSLDKAENAKRIGDKIKSYGGASYAANLIEDSV